MIEKLSRRAMIQSLCGGLGSVGLAGLLSDQQALAAATGHYAGPHLPAKAKHVICLFMAGGPSHVDLFDPKPALLKFQGQRPNSVDLRTERQTGGLLPSPFEYKKQGQNGIEISELLPQISSVIDDICVIRSMYTFNPTHTPARSLFHTGSLLATRPSTGAWISYGLGTENENLPAFVVLTPRGGIGESLARAGFLPSEHQGISFSDEEIEPEKMIPDLRNKWSDPDAQRRQLDALQALNRNYSASFGTDPFLEGRIKSMEAAYRMQFEALDVFDVRKETDSIRSNEYGRTPFANGCLLARRLVERGVRYIHINYAAGQVWGRP